MEGCIFCKILAREIPSTDLYEDDYVLCFLDINPINPGHALVIPKTHSEFLSQMGSELSAPMWDAGRKIAAALRKSDIQCEGINFHLADGSEAGQEIPHVHLHVIPRFKGDGSGFHFPPGRKRPDEETWNKLAESIRANVE